MSHDAVDHRPVGCRTCGDYKKVYSGVALRDCRECSSWSAEHRTDMLKQATRRDAEKPSIRLVDLSDEEKALVKEWRLLHPHVHELTLLTWVEGMRYDPSKDPGFLADARKRFKKWQFLRNSNEGPVPGWALAALEAGDYSGLSKNDIEYVNSMKEAK